jgi:DNA-binding MarR family transcriptional regulator
VSSEGDGPGPVVGSSLGYLLKHAQQQLFELTNKALAPYGIVGRELAVLLVLDGAEPASQLEMANRLGIDRTTMVAMLNTLEDKGIVQRTMHGTDRRKNVVELTPTGRDTLAKARTASHEAERQFLAGLDDTAAAQLRSALQAVVRSNSHQAGGVGTRVPRPASDRT